MKLRPFMPGDKLLAVIRHVTSAAWRSSTFWPLMIGLLVLWAAGEWPTWFTLAAAFLIVLAT